MISATFYQKPDELYLLLWPTFFCSFVVVIFSVPPVFASFVWTHLLVIKVLFKFNYDTTHLGFGSPAQKLKMWKLWRCEGEVMPSSYEFQWAWVTTWSHLGRRQKKAGKSQLWWFGLMTFSQQPGQSPLARRRDKNIPSRLTAQVEEPPPPILMSAWHDPTPLPEKLSQIVKKNDMMIFCCPLKIVKRSSWSRA